MYAMYHHHHHHRCYRTGDGACSFVDSYFSSNLKDPIYVSGVSPDFWTSSLHCGECMEVLDDGDDVSCLDLESIW